MSAEISQADHGSRRNGSTAGLLELGRFLRPFMVSSRKDLIVAAIFASCSLVAAAVIPLLLDRVLSDRQRAAAFSLMVLLMVVDIVGTFLTRRFSSLASTSAAERLSGFIYARTLDSPMLRQIGLRRPSVISRHTSDVDRIEEALDQSLTEGFPAVVQICLSLSLLLVVEPKAGVAMMAGTLLFALVNSSIGRHVLGMDKARLDASSEVGAVVDESITAARAVTGMNIGEWMLMRFAERARRLRDATAAQRGAVSRIYVAARTAGYIALAAVAAIAVVGGSAEAGAIAAALLYINSVVAGLERLPAWLRNTRLAVTSKRRIERITTAAPRVSRVTIPSVSDVNSEGLRLAHTQFSTRWRCADNLVIPPGTLVSLVLGAGETPAPFLEALAGDADPLSGSVLLDGVDVRHPAVKLRISLVVSDNYLMDASTAEHLHAASPQIDTIRVSEVLDSTGLAHLVELDGGGIHAPLGTHAERLSAHERQRLMLAMIVASSADVVVVDELPVLADVDGAEPLLAALTSRPGRIVVLPTRSAEIAARSDLVIATWDGTLHSGSHAQLLNDSHYRDLWRSQSSSDIDAAVLAALPPDQREAMRSRLTTERHTAGEILMRAGSPSDRMMFIVAGRVEVIGVDDAGSEVRVAEIGAGNFCGDVSRVGARQPNTIRALDDTVVRTLSNEAWTAGVMGLLDADPLDRRILGVVVRGEHPTVDAVVSTLAEYESDQVKLAIATLVNRGQLKQSSDGSLSLVARRRVATGTTALLDRISDPDPDR